MKASFGILVLSTLMSISAFANCMFRTGETLTASGARHSTHFSPKVVSDHVVDLTQTGVQLHIRSPHNFNLHLIGYRSCQAYDDQAGFDCFEVDDYVRRRNLRAYVSNNGRMMLKLVEPVGMGGKRVDHYQCTSIY